MELHILKFEIGFVERFEPSLKIETFSRRRQKSPSPSCEHSIASDKRLSFLLRMMPPLSLVPQILMAQKHFMMTLC